MVYKLAASILHKHIMMPTSVMYKEGSGVQYFLGKWDPTWACIVDNISRNSLVKIGFTCCYRGIRQKLPLTIHHNQHKNNS